MMVADNLWAVLLLSIIVAHARRIPTITYITQDQIKDIGDTVEFDCSAQYAEEYNVLFLKTDPDQVFISHNSKLNIKDSRFSMHHEPNSTTYKLQIKDIQETDAGTYTCMVPISIVHRASADVKLSVRHVGTI